MLAPLYHAADEPNHADAVMRIEGGRGWSPSTHATVTLEGVGAISVSPFGKPPSTLSLFSGPIAASQAPSRNSRPTWQDLKPPPGVTRGSQQQTTQHPPGYYYYEGLILRAGGAAGWRWDIAVSTMRLLSALLIVWLPLLSWATAWRISGSRLAGIAASVFPLAVPELTHVGATVNNDNLVTLAGAATLLGVTCAMRGDRSKLTALWTGLWTVIALWAKAFGLVLVPLVIAVYAGPWLQEWWSQHRPRRSRPADSVRRKRSWLPDRRTGVLLGLSGGIAIALGCWWYVISEVRYGSSRPPVPGFPPGRQIGHHIWTFLTYLTRAVLGRWWGDFGWSEVHLPWRLDVAATIIVGLIAILGWVIFRGRRLALVLLLWPTLAAYFVVVAQASSNYFHTHYVSGLSGRYLFVGFTGIAALVGVGCAALPAKVARWTPAALLIGAIGMQVESAHLSVDHWWRPVGGTLRQAWASFSAWSTWPVGVLWAGFSLLGLFTVIALIALIMVGVRGTGLEVVMPQVDDRGDAPISTVEQPTEEPAAAETPATDQATASGPDGDAVSTSPVGSAPKPR